MKCSCPPCNNTPTLNTSDIDRGGYFCSECIKAGCTLECKVAA